MPISLCEKRVVSAKYRRNEGSLCAALFTKTPNPINKNLNLLIVAGNI